MKKNLIRFAIPVVAAVTVPWNSTMVTAKSVETFSDVHFGESGYEEVEALFARRIINGYGDETFRPYENISRQHIAVLLTRALKLPVPEHREQTLSVYKDVHEETLYSKEIAAVTAAGIFKGDYGDFRPKDPMTREQMATVIARAFHFQPNEESVDLIDLNEIDPSHREHVKILVQNGIVIGKEIGKERYFEGNELLKRVHFAIFLEKALEGPKYIAKIANNKIEISGRIYKVADSLKGILDQDNKRALIDAGISFEARRGTIHKIKSLHLSGARSNLQTMLDGKNISELGEITATGDRVLLSNFNILGRLKIEARKFEGKQLKVSGKALLARPMKNRESGGESSRATFSESSLETMEAGDKDTKLTLKENSTIDKIIVTENSSIQSDSNQFVPRIDIKENVSKVRLDGRVTHLDVASDRSSIQLAGKANIIKLTSPKKNQLDIDLDGLIHVLDLRPRDGVISLNGKTKVGNLLISNYEELPYIIENFSGAKKYIEKINGRIINESHVKESDQIEEEIVKDEEDNLGKTEENVEMENDRIERVMYSAIETITNLPEGVYYENDEFIIAGHLKEFAFRDGDIQVFATRRKDTWIFQTKAVPQLPASTFIIASSDTALNGNAKIIGEKGVISATVASELIDEDQYMVKISFKNEEGENIKEAFELGSSFTIEVEGVFYIVNKSSDYWLLQPTEDGEKEAAEPQNN